MHGCARSGDGGKKRTRENIGPRMHASKIRVAHRGAAFAVRTQFCVSSCSLFELALGIGTGEYFFICALLCRVVQTFAFHWVWRRLRAGAGLDNQICRQMNRSRVAGQVGPPNSRFTRWIHAFDGRGGYVVGLMERKWVKRVNSSWAAGLRSDRRRVWTLT